MLKCVKGKAEMCMFSAIKCIFSTRNDPPPTVIVPKEGERNRKSSSTL
jgi:hypothetical protein